MAGDSHLDKHCEYSWKTDLDSLCCPFVWKEVYFNLVHIITSGL
jgi:hypothetical protein